MGKVLLTLPIRNTSTDVLTANTAPRIEVFPTAGHTTSAEATPITLLHVNDISLYTAGDTLWVGAGNTESVVAAGGVPVGTGAGDITLNTAISYSDNDAVIRSVSYATIYADPEYSQTVTFPLVSDANNQWEFFAKAGRYGIRYSTTTTTLQTHHNVVWDELDWVQVAPETERITASLSL